MKDTLSIDPESYENLRRKLICGEITAITFDTQIFDRNGRTFRGGLVGQLGQLKSSNIQLVITELVYDEAERHMLAMHRARAMKVDDALSHLDHHVSEDLLDEVREELSARMSPEKMVFHELNDFFFATDAELISYEETSTRKLFERYFMSEPPFHKQNAKKSEFPDAIALLCLEEYAKNDGVLVVSEDNDWITFCRESKTGNLHCVPDLSIALTLINSVKSDIKEIADKRFGRLMEFSSSGALESAVKHNAIERLKDDLVVIGRTVFFYSSICAGVDVISVKHGEDMSFSKIRDDSSLTAWVLELDLECRIETDVTFTSDDEVYLGSSRYESILIVPSVSIIKITNENISVETLIHQQATLNLGAIAPNEHRLGGARVS